MEFNLSIRRLVVLLILLITFWALGGFSPPIVPDSAYQSAARVQKAWTYCLILYLTGAGCATIVDHFVGTLDRSNLRFLYIILGALLMISSLLWLHVITDGIRIGNQGHDTVSRQPLGSFARATYGFNRRLNIGRSPSA